MYYKRNLIILQWKMKTWSFKMKDHNEKQIEI